MVGVLRVEVAVWSFGAKHLLTRHEDQAYDKLTSCCEPHPPKAVSTLL